MIAPKQREDLVDRAKQHLNNNKDFYQGTVVGTIGGVLGVLLMVTFRKTPTIFLNVEYPVMEVPVTITEA